MNGVLDSDGQNLMVSRSGSRGKEGKFASSRPLPAMRADAFFPCGRARRCL